MWKNQFRFRGVHEFKRSLTFNCPYVPNTGFQWATTNAFGFALSTSLSQLGKYGGGAPTYPTYSGNAELSALFDAYRIKNLRVTMFFTANSSEASTTAGLTQSLPVILYAVDHTDVTVPGAATTLCEYANMKQFQFGGGTNKLVINVKPRALITGSGNNGSIQTNVGEWFPVSGNTQEFFGLKFYSPQSGTAATATGNLVVIIEQTMEFKDIQ